jgi:hypothetical protein
MTGLSRTGIITKEGSGVNALHEKAVPERGREGTWGAPLDYDGAGSQDCFRPSPFSQETKIEKPFLMVFGTAVLYESFCAFCRVTERYERFLVLEDLPADALAVFMFPMTL